MTTATKIRLERAPDLSIDNPVMNFRNVPLSPEFSLAGASWLVVGATPLEALRSALGFVLQSISAKMFTHNCWLLIGNSAWQPKSRLVQHRKLWGALTARGIDVPGKNRMQHTKEGAEGKLKFFGAIQISEFSVDAVARALIEELCAYVGVLPDGHSPRTLLEIGWSGGLIDDLALLERVSEVDGLLLRRVGEFDDEEWGLVAVGNSPILDSLLR